MDQGNLIADKYRLGRPLGDGGMGVVFAAVNVMTGKAVAIKRLHDELAQNDEYSARFLREAQVAGRIDHPNVVNVFDVVRHDGALYLVMELLSGETLGARLQRGPQDPTTFAKLMLPVLRGVHAAHRIGVTHRDLKPDNILLCEGPDGEPREAKVLDFGISKLGGELADLGLHQLTLEGAVFGTPQYMAPEQIRSARSADARSDVYALGIIFYRALSGDFPFEADSLPGLALSIVEGNPPPLDELCPALDKGYAAAVMRCLAVKPDDRFATVAALAEALEPYAGGFTFSTSPGTWAGSSDGGRRVHGAPWYPSQLATRSKDLPVSEEKREPDSAREEVPAQLASMPVVRHESAPRATYLLLLVGLLSSIGCVVWAFQDEPLRMGRVPVMLRVSEPNEATVFAASMPYVTTLEVDVLPEIGPHTDVVPASGELASTGDEHVESEEVGNERVSTPPPLPRRLRLKRSDVQLTAPLRVDSNQEGAQDTTSGGLAQPILQISDGNPYLRR